jgi:hypothetical protein
MPLGSGAVLVMLENERILAELAGLVCADAQMLAIAIPRMRVKKEAAALCADIYFSKGLDIIRTLRVFERNQKEGRRGESTRRGLRLS